MKCSHPMCNRSIGLVSHRRSWLGKKLYCSRRCRDDYAPMRVKPPPPQTTDARLFAWLFATSADTRPVLVPVRVRAR